MDASRSPRVLVITDHATPTLALLDAMEERASNGDCQFRLVVTNPAPSEWHLRHPERHVHVAAAERVLQQALPGIEAAAQSPVTASVSIRHNPYEAVEETMAEEPVDEVLVAVASHGSQRWLHLDLPHRLHHFGLPVTTVDEEAAVPVG